MALELGTKTTVQKIQQIVNKFIRMILGLHHRASVTNIMKDNGIMTIDQINKLELQWNPAYLTTYGTVIKRSR